MRALQRILEAYGTALARGKKTALATVVHVDGSSYRKPGARMLVDEDGNITGAISGGCLEGDALRKALLAIAQNKPRLVVYDTRGEDEASVGVQLGCEGIIQVLFEPIDPDCPENPVELIRNAVKNREASVLVTLFNRQDRNAEQAGTSLLFKDTGEQFGETWLQAYLSADIQSVIAKEQSLFVACEMDGETMHAFIERLQPPVSLVIVGAGHDAIPLMQIADTLGWEVRVVDGRSTHARAERFAAACQILVSKPEAVLQNLKLDERTVFVMLTHNYQYDKAMLRALLPLDLPYVGMLGPRKKLDRMVQELRQEGLEITDMMLEKVHGPTGLEIGAETPEEIALSIVAEIQAVLAGRPGGHLKLKKDVIHDRREAQVIHRKIEGNVVPD